ncbi:MAG TPA: hypothetical protein VME46_17990 [Acidimicrobiales bacterium]|nr:hypothetical protein [Acidimicrobiales bacterium]
MKRAISPDGSTAYVANTSNGDITTIGTATNEAGAAVPTGHLQRRNVPSGLVHPDDIAPSPAVICAGVGAPRGHEMVATLTATRRGNLQRLAGPRLRGGRL